MGPNQVVKMSRVAALLAGLCASLTANAGIVFTLNDSETDLRGNFAFQSGESDTATPAVFKLLPGLDGYLLGQRAAASGAEPTISFLSSNEGIPEDPLFEESVPQSSMMFGALGGSYTNSGQVEEGGTPVYWLFSGFEDGGGTTGVFMGSFCFSTSRTGCEGATVPEPGTLALLGLGLAGLATSRRRRK